MRTFSLFFILALFLGVCSCSDSDSYNADTAKSSYQPNIVEKSRMVASVKTTNTLDGRNYSWEHKFAYDVQGRIKEINSQMLHHQRVYDKINDIDHWYECHITSKANYYFKGKKLEVDYAVEKVYPEAPERNYTDSGSNYGHFNEAGVLEEFASIDFVYSATSLQRAYVDGGTFYEFVRSRGDVTGFVKYFEPADSIIKDRSNEYTYAVRKNITNFDFSAYFGYWEIEQNIIANRSPYYASYQLGAFGFLGAVSVNLPLGQKMYDGNGKPQLDSNGVHSYGYGEWKYDSAGRPAEFTDATGRKTVVTYVE